MISSKDFIYLVGIVVLGLIYTVAKTFLGDYFLIVVVIYIFLLRFVAERFGK
jgi:hypothetical protein